MNQNPSHSHSGRNGAFGFLALFVIVMLAIILLFASTGCSSFPNVACDSWQHEGHYGPVTTHYDAQKVVRQDDGSLKIDQYSGSVVVLGGYGVTDTVKGLVLSPAQAKAPAVDATKAVP